MLFGRPMPFLVRAGRRYPDRYDADRDECDVAAYDPDTGTSAHRAEGTQSQIFYRLLRRGDMRRSITAIAITALFAACATGGVTSRPQDIPGLEQRAAASPND